MYTKLTFNSLKAYPRPPPPPPPRHLELGLECHKVTTRIFNAFW